ncbi:MAG: TIGR02281 family clan AA aspartic protease [Chromatiaceae bacterium]|nr:TIGR02281 family clan AA aspartic protease [Chromatiaceae bacterium]MBP8197411.1 TIGR02281 family clan AA aspartic protease [Chromatiaceae bacterium]
MYEKRSKHNDIASRLGRAMLFAAWIVGLALLVMVFQRLLGEVENPNRDLAISLDMVGRPQVMLARNRAGHYVAPGRINGEPVVFMIDTGATDVALPLDLAKSLDLRLGAARISRTANGDVQTWAALLDEVDLGGLAAQRVRASVLPNMPGDQVLLGMSYLKRFEMIQRDGTLILRAPD